MPTAKGQPTKHRYTVAAFLVDHYSDYVHVTFHEKQEATELMHSKQDFEAFAQQHNVHIKSIHADNGIYSSKAFRITCANQRLTFCAVGSHWQNGKAERTIGTIQTTARTILLHAITNWPSVINESFWTFAVKHAVNIHNIITRRNRDKSPYEKFTGEQPNKNINDLHVLGCSFTS
jgi:hypothetical protein